MPLSGPMVPVATLRGPFEAKLVAARLGAEGIVCELRGGVDAVYPMGPVSLLVEEGMAAEVRELLHVLADEAPDEVDEPVAGLSAHPRLSTVVTVAVVVAIAAFLATRLLALG